MPGLQYNWPNQSLVRADRAGPGVNTTNDTGTNPPGAHPGAATNNDVFTGSEYASITAQDAPNAAKLGPLGFYADPQTNWSTGQKITVNGFLFNWNGTAWAAGSHAVLLDADEGFDPGAHTVAEVEQYLADHPDEAEAVLEAEAAGKNRTTLTGG